METPQAVKTLTLLQPFVSRAEAYTAFSLEGNDKRLHKAHEIAAVSFQDMERRVEIIREM